MSGILAIPDVRHFREFCFSRWNESLLAYLLGLQFPKCLAPGTLLPRSHAVGTGRGGGRAAAVRLLPFTLLALLATTGGCVQWFGSYPGSSAFPSFTLSIVLPSMDPWQRLTLTWTLLSRRFSAIHIPVPNTTNILKCSHQHFWPVFSS